MRRNTDENSPASHGKISQRRGETSRETAAAATIRVPCVKAWQVWLAGFLLAAGVLTVYWPVHYFDFVNLDDPIYVATNSHVQAGLTRASLGWAWRTTDGANWHPLTWMSLMLDCQLFGAQAGKLHLVNLLLHLVNSVLLFLVFLRLAPWRTASGEWAVAQGQATPAAVWRSFMVAAIFAWHPMHVESVAWVSERKDVLSTMFFLLTIWAYARYAQHRRAADAQSDRAEGSGWSGAGRCYALALLFFALGLLSKPMLVTTPFVLLLLDYWPLARLKFPVTSWLKILAEKAPFFLLAAVFSIITYLIQKHGHAMPTMDSLPLEPRVANAIDSYYRYLGRLLWPSDMAVFYVYGHPSLNLATLGAGGLLLVITVLAPWLRRWPYVTVGWWWYMGTLVPVIGLVQVGGQAMADRYTYIPSIGLSIIAVFGVSDLARWLTSKDWGGIYHGIRPFAGPILSGLGALLLLVWLVETRRQVLYWQNGETLYTHAIAVTQSNYVACNNLGITFDYEHRYKEAIGCYSEAIRIRPDYADAYCNRGIALVSLKEPQKAQSDFELALRMKPELASAHYFLANQLLAEGKRDAAVRQYQQALAAKPDYAEAHYQLAILSLEAGQTEEAIRHYREALSVKPDWTEPLNNLAWLLATAPDARFRDGADAVRLGLRAVALTHTNNPGALDTLAGAYAEDAQFDKATATARLALQLAQQSGPAALTNEILGHLKFYEQRQPYREKIKTLEGRGPDHP